MHRRRSRARRRAGAAAARQPLAQDPAVGNFPLGRPRAGQVAVDPEAAVDAARRVIAEARGIEARELEIRREPDGLAQADAPGPARLALAGARTQRVDADLVAAALGIRGETQVLLRQRSLHSLSRARELELERAGEASFAQARINPAQVEPGDANFERLDRKSTR